MFLIPVLHLYDKTLPLVCHAINIINDASHCFCIRQLFFILESDVGNVMLAFQQVIQKTNEQVFIDFLPKKHLEPPIRKRIDEFSHNFLFLFCKYTDFIVT